MISRFYKTMIDYGILADSQHYELHIRTSTRVQSQSHQETQTIHIKIRCLQIYTFIVSLAP